MINAADTTRQRLMDAGLEVFAERGYHKASTREICHRAGANIASINYHFRDKAGLYREVFRLPFLILEDLGDPFSRHDLSPREKLAEFYGFFLQPLRGDASRQRLLRLYAREEFEPSGVLGDTRLEAIRPRHERLTAFLCRQLGISNKPDVEIERLAFCIVGLGSVFYQARDVVTDVEPRLISGKGWEHRMAERLADFAIALIESEAKRRKLDRSKR